MSRQKKATKRGKKQGQAKQVESSSEILAASNQNDCPFDMLLDELVLNIFVNFKLAKIETLNLVCSRWRQITTRQEYWRFHAINKWGKDIVPNSYDFNSGGSIQVDLEKYMIPTFKIGNTTTVDWRKYFKIRFFWEEVKFALDRHYYLMREEYHDPIIGPNTNKNKGQRTILISEGLSELKPEDWEELDEMSWSWSSDDGVEYGDYLDDPEYRKALKLDDDEPSSESFDTDVVNRDQEALYTSPAHRYTEDLYTASIRKFFMRVPKRENAMLDLPERFPRLLTYFSMEVYPMLLEAKFYPELIVATQSIFRCASKFHTDAISKNLYDLCTMVEDKPRLMAPLLFATCNKFSFKYCNLAQTTLLRNILQKLLELSNSEKILATSDAFNKVLREIKDKFDEEADERIIIESFIGREQSYDREYKLRREDSKRKKSMTMFLDPFKKFETFGIVLEDIIPHFGAYFVTLTEDFIQVLVDFIIEKFNETKSDAEKITLLTLSEIETSRSLKKCLGLFPFACEATKHKNDDVAFAAYTLLYRNMSAKTAEKFPMNLISTVFEALVRGLDRFPGNSMCIIVALTKLLKHDGQVITDKQLADLNGKILANLAKPAEFFNPDVLLTSNYFLFDNFYKLGEIFGERMASYLPKYRKAILEAGKAEIDAAIIISKKGDKEILEMNSSPQRWIQYSLLGQYCGGEQFAKDEVEFVREIMKFRSKKDEDDLSPKTEKEFHALFADSIATIIGKKDKKKFDAHIDKVLGIFPADIVEFGKGYYSCRQSYNGITPRTSIPETAAQFEIAMEIVKMEKSKKGKNAPPEETLVNYIYSRAYLDGQQKDKNVKKSTKKYLPEFNTVKWENFYNVLKNSEKAKVMKLLPYRITQHNLLNMLDEITNMSLLLKAFHIILAFAKCDESDEDLIMIVMELYERLKDKFDENTQCFYINTLASIIATQLNRTDVPWQLRRLSYSHGTKLASEYFKLQSDNYAPIVAFLSYSIQLDALPRDRHFRMGLAFDTLKLLILKSPYGVYQAVVNCAESGLLYVDHPDKDPLDPQYVYRLHCIALLGFHFGLHLLFCLHSDTYSVAKQRNLKRFAFDELGDKFVDYLKRVDRTKVMPQKIDRMERVLVLFKAYQSDGMFSNVRFINLYNAIYLETANIKKIIRGKSFTTGIADLDKRAKKWENVYDLTKTVFYDAEGSDDEFSDDE